MTYYVYVDAKVSPDGNFADCTYYYDRLGTQSMDSSTIKIPQNAGDCTFQQVESSDLLLIGATFKTLGSTPGMNASNFAPANDENAINFTMPLYVITKGVVLLFSTRGSVQSLYPSSDPEVINDGPWIGDDK